MGSYIDHALWAFEEACRSFDATEEPHQARANKHRIIMFGVAAITLDAARVDCGAKLPTEITTEQDQFIALAYMLRCAPAHDISIPVWKIKEKYRRPLKVGPDVVDLTDLNEVAFDFAHIGGPEVFLRIGRYAIKQGWVASS